ncbi:hypothetical protein [Sphingomonas phyllosphaerae]|uniref:hypothetical protein n=1 Tax=Sphingomonas phyllosphaerae TaxID=257003 RepID=UPI00241355A9|nr:hypothetical protein [Sphingomonas phyllosphaerae]
MATGRCAQEPSAHARSDHESLQEALGLYPGVIVASIILPPDGDLIPRTLRENGVRVPSHGCTVRDCRDIDADMKRIIGVAHARHGQPQR